MTSGEGFNEGVHTHSGRQIDRRAAPVISRTRGETGSGAAETDHHTPAGITSYASLLTAEPDACIRAQ